MNIVLTTLNSRYTHTAVALRYLYANMQELQDETIIQEFTINENVQSIAEQILAQKPRIIGISVYIWNASEVHQLIEILKKISPQSVIVLGGPEASHLPHRVDFSKADYIIQGEGDIAFYKLCSEIIAGTPPTEKIIAPVMANLKEIKLPYDYYSDSDVANRYIYVEASRGCPFLCEFCLSAIDEKVRNFDIDALLVEFEKLWQRGARNFKFIDRTFNLNMKFANALLDFFLTKEPPYFAHFEVVPDHFPESLKERIAQFPAGALQLEVGIQTLDPVIAENINRPLKIDKIKENLAYLENETKAHMHVDLIIGLPGETLEGFGRNLKALSSITSCEIQIGILKHLSGTTMSRHDRESGMIYSDLPPYDILQNDLISFAQIQEMKRFARFWDLVYNSGNFINTTDLLFKETTVYDGFTAFSKWLYAETQSTWKISLDRLTQHIFDFLTQERKLDEAEVIETMLLDITRNRGRKVPLFMRKDITLNGTKKQSKANKRQIRLLD
ncbi:MAG: DUF4080 domain-containing protein [Helicobacteraceae bacterium]|nr:DUF4080 domain-containing protein [Helicobacteraceae bacterium]